MKRLLAATAVVVGLFGASVADVRAEVTPDEVRQAIDRGVRFLKGQQQADGAWSEDPPFSVMWPGGVTSLCTLALLNAGVEPDDPAIQNALRRLRGFRTEKTYVVALQTMVFARAEPERDRLLIARNVRWLEKTQLTGGPSPGAWTYFESQGDGDNSNSQFALLALHEAERAGVAVKTSTWTTARKYWERQQNDDGSWGYRGEHPVGTGSMTCAGIASLVITADKAQAGSAQVKGERIVCCASEDSKEADRIERGLQWLGQHYSVAANPMNRLWHLYYLYGLERTGRITARRFIPLPPRPGEAERADWYREGADWLVRNQDGLSGFWVEKGDRGPLIGTSFALLFLSKGRWPVLLGKAQYTSDNGWNRHRADAANLTRYVETRWKRDLTWQVVDLRLATVEDLVQTPVLYLSGDGNPLPDDPAARKTMARKLRDYLDRGGFLFADANCGSLGFDAGFRALMAEVFPEPEYKLRLLEPEHPIWYAEEKVDTKQLRPLWGVDFGCRTSVVYAPPDPPQDARPSLSCLWELSRPGRETKYPDSVQEQIDGGLSIGINVLAYATNRELRSKEDYFRPAHGASSRDKVERGRLYVANLRHPGGCTVAPRALANLMDAASRELKIRTEVRDEPLDITDEALFDYHLVFMHGRSAFRLTDAERRRLNEYVERGGMILADALCANRAFTESFRREMAAIFPDRKLERIPADDRLWTTAYGGFDLRTVSRRDPAPAGGGRLEAEVREVPPELEGAKFGDRWGVVFSPFDLSCALEKNDSLECRGYVREDAARIGLNVVLYSLQQ
jgi:hypothetical protein